MSDIDKIDNHELDRLYHRLLYQKGGAFFCIIVNKPLLHVKIAESVIEKLPENSAQIIDFSKLQDFSYSSANLKAIMQQGVRYVFLANFQLSAGNLSDDAYFQMLNMSRDVLAEMPVVFIFITPMYFRVQIAQIAKDFNSFFIYQADFVVDGSTKNVQEDLLIKDDSVNRYSESNRELLRYYEEKYNALTDIKSINAFNTITNMLYINSDIRVLKYLEANRLYKSFSELLEVYQNAAYINPMKIAYIYRNQGDYKNALVWYKRELKTNQENGNPEDLSAAIIYYNIAVVYDDQGDYPKALDWYRKALVIREKVLGADHPDTAATYNNIGVVYDEQGDYNKALEWYRKALAIREKVLGMEHPDTAETYNNIAGVYDDQGDYPKALEWYRKALTIRGKILGVDHPDTAETYNNIAVVYDNQGDYNKALEWYRKDLAIIEKVLGMEHPSTATTYNNIAGVYDDQEDYPKALVWYRKALAIYEKVLGADHPSTVIVKNNIAQVVENIQNNKS